MLMNAKFAMLSRKFFPVGGRIVPAGLGGFAAGPGGGLRLAVALLFQVVLVVSAQRQPAATPPPAPPASAAPAAPAGPGMDSLDDRQKLEVGDAVSFRVLEDQEPAKILTVTDAGELDVPELGIVTARGKTCKQLALEVKGKLEAVTYYHATVIIATTLLNQTASGRKVYIAGQVRQPGPQEIRAGVVWTVSKAILAAGGFTETADKKSVHLVRAGAQGAPARTIHLNMVDIWEKGRVELDLPVEAEDLIFVPKRSVNFN